MSLIELKGLNKYVGSEQNQQHILKDVNLTIEKGEYISIVGQSGSGKSTLMNLLGCLDTATSGQYLFQGEDIYTLSDDELSHLRLKSFGFIFQRYNLLASLTAVENVALPAVYSNLKPVARNERALELLDQLGLSEKSQNRPNEMSGGQQQRVSIARALMNGGEVILADEPTGALDSESGEAVLHILEELHGLGHTIIVVTHDQDIAKRASRTIEIKDGRIIADTVLKRRHVEEVQPHFQADSKFSLIAQVYEASKMSLHSIFSNKLRSFLTMLGIIIGIFSVILVIALGDGAKEKFLQDWNGLKSAILVIYPGNSDFGGAASKLSVDDVPAIESLNEISQVSPNVNVDGSLVYLNQSMNTTATGADVLEIKLRNIKIRHGRFLTLFDIQTKASIIVLDKNTAVKLFKSETYAIGKSVLFNKRPFEVVGVVEPNYSYANSEVWIPYTVLMSLLSRDKNIGKLTAVVNEHVDADLAETKLEQFLTIRHGYKDFVISNSQRELKDFTNFISLLTFFISAVAFISLVVGGVGVMNIMLVSVTERIKEIGLRIAVGARQSDVRRQFLIESAVLCLIGGLLGVVLAYITSVIFNLLDLGYIMIFSWWIAIIALIFSTVVGLIFGYLPAKRAASLRPIEALAQE